MQLLSSVLRSTRTGGRGGFSSDWHALKASALALTLTGPRPLQKQNTHERARIHLYHNPGDTQDHVPDDECEWPCLGRS